MENKINIAELLKDCPKGMKLYSPLCGECKFHRVYCRNEEICIEIKTNEEVFACNKYGYYFYGINGEVIIFPSKENRDWSKFQKPFIDGDILVSSIGNPFILKEINKYNNAVAYCALNPYNDVVFDRDNWTVIKGCRLATEEEKTKLFDAIKANGYRWNTETKTLEKLPKFKVGDKIKSKTSENIFTVIDIRDGVYILSHTDDKFGYHVPFRLEKDYELIPNKFDITTLKPFNKVLIRDRDTEEWNCHFFSYYRKNSDTPYVCIGYDGTNEYKQCIPYGENKHLLGTSNNCDEYYKNW